MEEHNKQKIIKAVTVFAPVKKMKQGIENIEYYKLDIQSTRKVASLKTCTYTVDLQHTTQLQLESWPPANSYP